MNVEILEQNQTNLDLFKDAIMHFVSPKVLDEQMQNLLVLNKNLRQAKEQNKEANAWLKDNDGEMRDECLSFFKRYEKCYNRIQSFSKKFAENTIKKQLESSKDLLTKNFEAKANFNAQAYALAVGNFDSDIHTKTIFVEEKYQKGAITADSALDHIGRLQNCYEETTFSGNDEDLKHLLGSYRADYAKKSIFKNAAGTYQPESVLSSATISICKSEAAECNELRELMSETANTIFEFNKKLNVANVNNMLVDARQFVASFGSADWDERKADKFMDKFERQCADLEKLQYEIATCQNKLDSLIMKIKDKQKQTEAANKQVAKSESKKRLKALNENIDKVNVLMKKRTPSTFLGEHLRVLTNDYENIKTALGPEVDEEISKILSLTKERLDGLGASVHEAEMAQGTAGLAKEKILEVKIDFDDDEKPKK